MTGWEQNHSADSLNSANVEEAASRLAHILDEEDADVLVGYDWHGNYGHPDHVKVHHIARRAAELAAHRPRLLESTMNRDRMRVALEARIAAGEEVEFDPDSPMDDGNPIGSPEADISWLVDVSGYLAQRRAAVAAHVSQKTDTAWINEMPDEAFAMMFGTEWYIEPGRPQPMQEGWPFLPPT
jgi:LmbE family N-acetylglucosaminyl deacetylase